ncbi:hypothetical protein ACOCEA_09070 [Maribacter sp. CXY002]|uniref:hypothetical protein n=1 Tax=Maribacter luteocoastalis TaxID=3407671 RepID=UPI003B66C773
MQTDTFKSLEIRNSDELLPYLFKYDNQKDSYLNSPYYFLLTGRKGLKVVIDDNNSIIFSEHPNLDDETIIFPPSNKEEVSFLNSLLGSSSNLFKSKIRIIRCDKIHQDFIAKGISEKYKLNTVEEKLLDWKYPSVIISVENVVKMKGKSFKDLRYNVNKVDRNEVLFVEYQSDLHYKDSLKLISKWSNRNVSPLFNEFNLAAPYIFLLNQLANAKVLKGYVLYYKKSLVALNILDNVLNNQEELTSLAFLADIDFKGIPSFMRYQVCNFLKNKGVNTIHIGGSETFGLYKFKKKLVPLVQLDLNSITNN